MKVSNLMKVKKSQEDGGGFDDIKISYIKSKGRAEEGTGTISLGDNQHVQGRYNIADSQYAHIVGNGDDETNRSNAHTLDWYGNGQYQGDVIAYAFNETEDEKISLLGVKKQLTALTNEIAELTEEVTKLKSLHK